MNTVPDASPRLSFKGWLFTVWLTKNKAFVKSVLSIWLGVLGATTAFDHDSLVLILTATGVAVLTLIGRLGLDAFDFFVSDVELP